MKEKLVNYTGRRRLICIALLLFILAGSSMAHAATGSGEDVQVNPTGGEAPPAALAEPADTTTYQGSADAFSLFYNPVLLGGVLGAVIVLAVGYVLIRRSRGKA